MRGMNLGMESTYVEVYQAEDAEQERAKCQLTMYDANDDVAGIEQIPTN